MKLKKLLYLFSGIALLTPALVIGSTSCKSNTPSKFSIQIIKPKINTNNIYYINEKYTIEGFKVKCSLTHYDPQIVWTTDNNCASISENGTLTFTSNKEGTIKVNIIATCKTNPNISATSELYFNVFDKQKETIKVLDGKYLGSDAGTFTLKFKGGDTENCTLTWSQDIDVEDLDFEKYSTFENEGIKYQISKIASNALKLENTKKITFGKTIKYIEEEAISSKCRLELAFLHESTENIEIADKAFSESYLSSIDISNLKDNNIPTFIKNMNSDLFEYVIIPKQNYDLWKSELPTLYKNNQFVGYKKWVAAKNFCDTANGRILIGYTDKYCLTKNSYVIYGRSWDFSSAYGLSFTQKNFDKCLPNTKIDGIAQNCFRESYGTLWGTIEFDGSLIKVMGYRAFEYSYIKTFKVIGETKLDTIGWASFFCCKYLKKVIFSSSVIKVVEAYAFQHCSSLESIVHTGLGIEQSCFPDFKEIKQYAFAATALTNVKLTAIDGIWTCAFEKCTSLTHFAITGKEHSLTEIPKSVFENCENLQEVEFGINIESIGTDCFKNCKNLKKLVLRNETKVVQLPNEGQIFTDVANVPNIYVNSSIFTFYTSSKWGELYHDNLKKL